MMLELSCIAILALWFFLRLKDAALPGEKQQLLLRFGVVAVSSWAAEDAAIHLYGFYGYSHEVWTVFVDRVPLLVACIWPVVIVSAFDLASSQAKQTGQRMSPVRFALLVAALVLADASMIEPISVDAGLWYWTQPGLFSVPPIGILGWSFFAFSTGLLLEKRPLWLLVLGPLMTHALLLIFWWGLFRWINVSLPPWPFVAVVACVALFVSTRVWRVEVARAAVVHVWRRAPAAAFFFVLLALCARPGADADDGALIAYAVAFAPPWVVILWRARRAA